MNYYTVYLWGIYTFTSLQEAPALQQLAKINTRIDNDNQHMEWLKASESEGLDKEPYNYRLKRGFKNEFIRINKINTAPRYLLYAPSGELVNNDFITPNQNNFKKELLSYLKE